jgi:hypothetical protein
MANKGSIKKGEVRNPKGRGKGNKNLVSYSIKGALTDAFIELQNTNQYNLVAWAKRDSRCLSLFYALSSRLIPQEIQANLVGKLEITKPKWFDDIPRPETAIHILPGKTEPETAGN